MLLTVALSMSGCIGRPKLDAERAQNCVRQTFAYAEISRDAGAPTVSVFEGEDKEFIDIGVFEGSPDAYRRLALFKVGRDRRIWRVDSITGDLRLIGMCD